MSRIAVTGGTGFVGMALMPYLAARGHHLYSLERGPVTDNTPINNLDRVEIGTEFTKEELAGRMHGCDAVIHLASRNHHSGEQTASDDDLYRSQILELTKTVYQAAQKADVQFFVSLSTIKVRENDGHPRNAYETYKRAAEQYLIRAAKTRMSTDENSKNASGLVILRPPLVYDLDAKGNFGRMVKLVCTGLPLPVPIHSGHRALISRQNLVSAIGTLIERQPELHEGVKILELSDGHHYSIREQFEGIASALGKRARFVLLPKSAFSFLFRMMRRERLVDSVLTDLMVSNREIESYCGWRPCHSWLKANLKET